MSDDRKRWIFLVLLFVVAIGGAVWYDAASSRVEQQIRDGLSQPATSPDRATTHDVKYIITGSARSVDITMENATGGTEQRDNVRVPSTITLRNVEPRSFLYISAQNNGETGSVTCEIEVDGETEETATSSGSYVIATCSGTAR